MAKVKLYDAGEGAAYKVARGISAQEAADAGLAVVELNFSTNPPAPVFGAYTDTQTGAAVEMTVHQPSETRVVPAGGAIASPAPAAATKGGLVNESDPIVHGAGDADIHADGSAPDIDALKAADEAAAQEGATDPTQPAKK